MSLFQKILYYVIKKKSDKAHREYYFKKNTFYIEQYNKCDNKKEARTIQKEIRELKKYWGTYPIQYFRYNMYQKSCPLSLSEMKDYIPDFFAYFLFYPQSFLERNILCEDKLLFHSICEGSGIKTPKTLIAIKDGRFLTHLQDVISKEEAYEIIQASQAEKIFCKPRYGVGGGGIHVFHKSDNQFINNKDHSELNADYLESIVHLDYILQEGLTQHPVMDQIYPHSINTFRIVTRYTKESGVDLLFVALRMGNKGMEVDNASSGGLYIKVDVYSGTLARYAISFIQEKHESHPYTGFIFKDFSFHFWDDIVRFTKSTALKFSDIKYVGWDIAYTVHGPVVIEANNGPDISILQDCNGGLRNEFEIGSPKDFWFSTNYSLKNLPCK